MNSLVYVDIDQGIYRVKLKVARNEKRKKKLCTWVFFFYKYGKIWSVPLEQKFDLEPLFSEEWSAKSIQISSTKPLVTLWHICNSNSTAYLLICSYNLYTHMVKKQIRLNYKVDHIGYIISWRKPPHFLSFNNILLSTIFL